MTTSQFQYLFNPIKIGNKTVKNRIVISSHTKLYGTEEKLYTDKHTAYYEERAKGGAGLIVTEMAAAHPGSAGNFPETPCAYLKENIPRFKNVTDGIHRYGATAMLQVYQCGQHGSSVFETSIKPIYGFSPLPCVALGETPKEMEIEDIKEIVDGFTVSSMNAEEGGFDGVELHGAHSYLLGQSMSPLFNRRTDDYGGSLENRMRFPLEVIESIRAKTGPDFILGMRLNGDDLVEGGLTIEESLEIAKKLEAHGMIDYLHISAGAYHAVPVMVGPMEVPLGIYVPYSAAIKNATDTIPVIAVNRINDPIQADEILKNGQADLVAMTRACLCDPDMPNKARKGELDDIRKCMACNQGCIARLWSHQPVTCVQNPDAGREMEAGMGALTQASVRKKVVIVGGGPAGLKAAETASARGHEVVLFEKEDKIGGQVNLAIKAPTREEFGQCIRYLEHRVNQLGVKTIIGTEVDAERVESEHPDAVVVATGSSPMKYGITGYRPYEIPGWAQDNVVTAENVIENTDIAGQRVVVIDDNNYHRSLAAVEMLADKGKKVTVITAAAFAFNHLYLTLNMPHAYGRLMSKNVEFMPQSAVKEISGNSVTVYNIYLPDKTEKKIEGVDTIVMVTARKADNALYLDLKKRGNIKELYNIGDSLSPRRIGPAIWEGLKTGKQI